MALTGLDFHQLDSFEGFHQLISDPPFPRFPSAIAWISTEPDLLNMALGQIAHFRVPSPQNYYAKWCSDNRIALHLLVHRPHDSGQFRGLLDEEMLGTGLYQRTNRPTAAAKFPSLVNRLALRMLGNSPSVEIQARETLSIGFRVLVARHPAIQTTGLLTVTPVGLSSY